MVDETANGRLSVGQNEHIFRTEILPDYLPADIRALDHPILIVLGGQPSSGKTPLLTASQSELEQTGNGIRIVADDLRPYHPGFVAHRSVDAVTASRFTQSDAVIWAEKLLAAALERRVHAVFETTMGTPDSVERIMTAGRSADYHIEARALAVSPRISWQSCLYRFEELHRTGVAARVLPRAVHNAAVIGLAESLEHIERRKLADRIMIQTADGEAVYDNALVHRRWRTATVAPQVLDEARNRPLSREEINRFAHVWTRVAERMENRGASVSLIDEVRAYSRDDLAWFLSERRRSEADDAIKNAHETKQRIGVEPPLFIPADIAGSSASRGDKAEVEENRRRDVRPGEVLIPGRELPDLREAEIAIKLLESSRLAEKRAEIDRLSQLVYGNTTAMSASVERIGDALAGSVAGRMSAAASSNRSQARAGVFCAPKAPNVRPQKRTCHSSRPRSRNMAGRSISSGTRSEHGIEKNSIGNGRKSVPLPRA